MQEIKNYLQTKGIYPKVDFDDKKPHTVKILKAREDEYEDGTTAMKVLVQEGGDPKVILATSILVEIQDCEIGDVFTIQMKYRRIGDKTIKTYDIKKVGHGEAHEDVKEPVDTSKEEIPVVEDGDPTPEQLKEVFGE